MGKKKITKTSNKAVHTIENSTYIFDDIEWAIPSVDDYALDRDWPSSALLAAEANIDGMPFELQPIENLIKLRSNLIKFNRRKQPLLDYKNLLKYDLMAKEVHDLGLGKAYTYSFWSGTFIITFAGQHNVIHADMVNASREDQIHLAKHPNWKKGTGYILMDLSDSLVKKLIENQKDCLRRFVIPPKDFLFDPFGNEETGELEYCSNEFTQKLLTPEGAIINGQFISNVNSSNRHRYLEPSLENMTDSIFNGSLWFDRKSIPPGKAKIWPMRLGGKDGFYNIGYCKRKSKSLDEADFFDTWDYFAIPIFGRKAPGK